jgi:hypothetical protein
MLRGRGEQELNPLRLRAQERLDGEAEACSAGKAGRGRAWRGQNMGDVSTDFDYCQGLL